MTIEYVDIDRWKYENLAVKGRLPGQDKMGYGKKITTGYRVLVGGSWYRVYATCFSNAASCWITKGGKKLHIHDTDFTHEKQFHPTQAHLAITPGRYRTVGGYEAVIEEYHPKRRSHEGMPVVGYAIIEDGYRRQLGWRLDGISPANHSYSLVERLGDLERVDDA